MALQVLDIKAIPLTRGHAIKLTWKNPTGVTFKEVVVHRRTDDFGLDPFSPLSVEVYRGTGNVAYDYHTLDPAVISDQLIPEYNQQGIDEQAKWLKGEQLYYYTLYAVDTNDVYYASYGNCVAMAPTETYGIGQWLYNQLPQVYRAEDSTLGLSIFCDLVGEFLDYSYSLTKMIRTLNNPGKVNPAYIPVLAQQLGWQLEQTLSTRSQRRVLQNAVNMYRLAGTKKGLDALIRYHSGFPSSSGVFEGQNTVARLVSFGELSEQPATYTDHLMPNFTTMDFTKIGTANDPLHYSWDFSANTKASTNKFTAYVQKTISLTPEQEQVIINRLTRVLNEFSPIGAQFEVKIF